MTNWVQLFQRHSQVSRQEIFGSDDPLPLNLRDDAHTMFAGYVGSAYRPGGLVLLAINPGGGSNTYDRRTPADETFYPLLAAFRRASPDEAEALFSKINAEFAAVLPSWNLWRIVQPVLAAFGATLDQIAYLNAVPYRTKGDAKPKAAPAAAAWRLVTGPTLDALAPGSLLALGKKACEVMAHHYVGSARTECLPRTIGDSYISAGARAVLDRIAAARSAS